MLPQLSEYLLGKWNDFLPIMKKPKKISYLGISGSVEGGTTTFLAFLDRNEEPSFVVRILRNPRGKALFLKERDMLLYLAGLGSFLGNSTPRLILCNEIAGKEVLVESVLKGKPMALPMDKEGIPKIEQTRINFELVSDWLLRFNKETKEKMPNQNQFIEIVRNMINEFQKIFPLSKEEINYLEQTAETAKNLKNIDLFLSHGDFCRQNILVSGLKIGIIDWISTKKSSLPLYDFLFFLTNYYLQERKGYGIESYIQAFQNTFFSPNPYSNLVRKALRGYCQKLGIDSSLILFFLTMFLVEKAVSEYREMVNLSEEGFIPRFALYLELRKDYQEALKEQIWIYFFHFLVKEKNNFTI